MASIAIYEEQINHYKAELAGYKRQLNLLGYLRLLSFLILSFFVYQYFRDLFEPIWLLPILLMLGVFAGALVVYTRLQEKQTLAKMLLELNKKEYELATTGKSAFYDGTFFMDDTHPYAGDLDVFGYSSIYSHMNRTGTLTGANFLAQFLKAPWLGVEKTGERQEVVKELAPKLQFRQLLTAQAALAGEKSEDQHELRLWLDMPIRFLNDQFVQVARWVSPALSVVAFIYLIATYNVYPLLAMLAINSLILRQFLKEINRQHILISSKERVFAKFSVLVQMINTENFGQAAMLNRDQEKTQEAGVALKRLARIVNIWDQRMNMAIGMLLNGLGLYDLHCAVILEKWKLKYKDKVAGWMDVIYGFEIYNSMATFAYNHPDFIYPEVNDTQSQLAGKGIGHPLIPVEECVKNDIAIGTPQQFLIITGSNMSGKSTFLRSVGCNLLLAMCGLPVCAEEFKCSPMKIMTSMRIKDSIAKHTSYFQAELLRLQEIVKVLKSGERVFILLDEILKGTNSEDKLSGSRSLIAHFLQYHCLGMIATHDLELGHMEEAYAGRIRNYCFESTIEDEQLFFDYRIREGVARNKNATFLMKKMEII
ncbi:MutS-related protein [Chitinophaga sancti]|uniref:MutS domain V n=1 Tax=Chitinophaga sancti TaxID=1004 RepID=A0A1K1RK92_9BACT|nr:hypothetical protein [Chitinophaga sancti]WQD60743.1 hypothetical protein U0033_22865 [Chitinophaga sancti]WQG87129.1 hypothetical protein SR876_19605 [Chitinophaga sancti]SFW72260.1 MutS domain V [Chitinophaga sancti]